MVRLSKNFTLQEFTKSQTAIRKGIDNTPAERHLENAKLLFEKVVQPVRDNFGPTVINSGYRGPDLNYARYAHGCATTSTGLVVVAGGYGKPALDLLGWLSPSYEVDSVEILQGTNPDNQRWTLGKIPLISLCHFVKNYE